MTPRRRLSKNINLPDNVYNYVSKGRTYYRYKHPLTRKMHSLGSNKTQAFAAARQLNNRLVKEDTLVADILSPDAISMLKLIERYENEVLPTKDHSVKTKKDYQGWFGRFKREIGHWIVGDASTTDVADYLDKGFQGESYKKHRSALDKLFRFSQTKGYRKDNPVDPTDTSKSKGKQRMRLKIEEFRAIHDIAPEWMKIAMEIALLTLQGRYEVVNMKFSDMQQDGYLYIIREKTKKNEWSHIRIKMNPELEALKSRAMKSGIVSPYVVHRRPIRKVKAEERDHWTQLTLNDFTRKFGEYRDQTGLFDKIPSKKKPSFHEIRALGSWLYEKQGFNNEEYVQPLMAHADGEMTRYYQSGHEIKWMECEAVLDIKKALSTNYA